MIVEDALQSGKSTALSYSRITILNAAVGVPRWSQGLVASLSQTPEFAMARGAPAGPVRLFGIDVDVIASLRHLRPGSTYAFSKTLAATHHDD